MNLSSTLNLGFLTVLHEQNGYVGGYLVTNVWGRPMEFRLSTAVQPNRVQQILYGGTLQPYVYADLIGKALVDKTGTAVQVILTDCEPVLELRLAVATPVAWLAPTQPDIEISASSRPSRISESPSKRGLVYHPLFPEDAQTVDKLLDRVPGHLDFTEPFARIQDAIAEARKMGVTNKR